MFFIGHVHRKIIGVEPVVKVPALFRSFSAFHGWMNSEDPRPILFDGQAVIGATGRTMTLPRYNAKMEAFF